MAENVSPNGAFIKTENWRLFHIDDQAQLTFFLPPEFTGQQDMIGLQGSAVITRVDEEQEGVGVAFVKALKQFEPITAPEVPGKFRYKKLAYYLTLFDEAPLKQPGATNPHGFLVERAERFLDKDVIFQFITEVADDRYVLEQLRQGGLQKEALEARVIEVKKRKDLGDAEMITIGRSPENDIVLYNKLVSRTHACLYLNDSTCKLVDMGSTNGTFLNENELRPNQNYQLADGDAISFGPETKVMYFSAQAFQSFLARLKMHSEG
jgi:hypothetical protein